MILVFSAKEIIVKPADGFFPSVQTRRLSAIVMHTWSDDGGAAVQIGQIIMRVMGTGKISTRFGESLTGTGR